MINLNCRFYVASPWRSHFNHSLFWNVSTNFLIRGKFTLYIYRVFIKYCFFSKDFRIFRTLFSLGVSVNTQTRQVKHQHCRRTGRVQKGHKILRKNTIFNEHPVFKIKEGLKHGTIWTGRVIESLERSYFNAINLRPCHRQNKTH